MIALRDSAPFPSPTALAAPGGFAWWYLDAVNEAGDGFVLIWSYGLPFLPGYGGAAREGAGQLPTARPSLNLAVYQGGAERFYLLQEHPPTASTLWGEGGADLGLSTLRTSVVQGMRQLDVQVRTTGPDGLGRLEGRFTLEAPALALDPAAQSAPDPHEWRPLATACEVSATLTLDGEPLLGGRYRAYHDRNQSAAPLHTLGIEHWIWGRVALPEEERIFYALWPEGGGAPQLIGLVADRAGQLRPAGPLRVELEGARRTLYGMTRWDAITLWEGPRPWLRVGPLRTLDSGPFYLRFFAQALAGEQGGFGVVEAVRPDRVDLSWQRPMINTRVHRVQGDNSRLLPVMSGPLGRFILSLAAGV